ncbi:putative toxin-antitoxin system antitoxin component [compost metagenome]
MVDEGKVGIEKALWDAAVELFEGEQVAAEHWLYQPLPALGGRTPLQAPLQEVLDLIGRLEHGVFT